MQIAAPAAENSPRAHIRRLSDAVLGSAQIRGAASLTLFPQHPEVDSSNRAQREDLAQVWREVYDCLWTAYIKESDRICEYERKK